MISSDGSDAYYEALAARLRLRKTKYVLMIGLGAARLPMKAPEIMFDVVEVDKTIPVPLSTNVNVIHADWSHHLHLPNKYDAIVEDTGHPKIPDLTEVERLLKEDGVFIALVPNGKSGFALFEGKFKGKPLLFRSA